MKIAPILLLFSIICVSSYAQTYTVRGSVKTTDNKPIQSATVTLQGTSDSSFVKTAISDSAGEFTFRQIQPGAFKAIITSVGYLTESTNFTVDTSDIDLAVAMRVSADELAGVTVTTRAPMAVQKGDTVQFNASQFKVQPDATAEDLARKMPGITVENGQVKAHGENVQKVTIDGRELFGDDATAALRNLPAEIIDKIQVFDRLSDQAQLTGVDDGSSTKGINIVTKANMRNGQFGRVFAGYGTDSRYAAGGNSTFLHENRKVSLVGNFNNINQQNFSAQDLLGVTNTNNQRGGARAGGAGGGRGGRGQGSSGGGGGNFQAGPNASNFLVGQQNGINKTSAAGINYSDNFGKNLIVTGSYFFNRTDNTTDESVNRQYFTSGISNYNQSTISNGKNINHRINGRIEYKLDSNNAFIFTPSVSFQSNNSFRNVNTGFYNKTSSAPIGVTDNTNTADRSGNNLNGNLLYRHSFAKKGRTFSININGSSNSRTGDVYNTLYDTSFTGGSFTDSSGRRFTDQTTSGYQTSANLVYTEPIAANAQLQFNYNPTYSKNKADQLAYVYDTASGKFSTFDSRLSSRFDNIFRAQNAGIAYRYGTRDNQVSFGGNYQSSELLSDQDFPRDITVRKRFNNILPNAMVRYKLSPKSNIRLFYRAGTNQPNVNQLQDVYDITNAPFITAGNPQLEQQYNHTVSTRYTYTNTTKGILFVGNVFVQATKNYITNATFVPSIDSFLTQDIVLKAGQQLTKPVNLDGYLSIRSFLNFAFPVKAIKSNVNLNGGVSYAKQPGIINNLTNISKNYTYTAGAVIASNVSQYVDFTVSYSANFNTVNNQLQSNLNTNYFSHVAGVQLNLLSKQGWFLQNDLNNQVFTGLAAGYNQNYTIWNMAIGKKFLKGQKGELKASVFDLLKQNRSITRNVTETYIEDVSNTVLQRYFMLTFSYNLRNFGAAAVRAGGTGGAARQGGRPPAF